MKAYQVTLIFIALLQCKPDNTFAQKVILISANAEWKVVKERFPSEVFQASPWGEFFEKQIKSEKVIFFHGGWGKVAAAGSTQYCIDQWHPKYIVNLGTCGGFDGSIARFETILVDRTVIYDIYEAMGDSDQAIHDYSTNIDLSWLQSDTTRVTKTLLVSGDRDIIPSDIDHLKKTYHAIAGDWETGAIAYTCVKNKQRVLILRGVSDLVSPGKGGEAYGNEKVFVHGTEVVMKKLLDELPDWLDKCK